MSWDFNLILEIKSARKTFVCTMKEYWELPRFWEQKISGHFFTNESRNWRILAGL